MKKMRAYIAVPVLASSSMIGGVMLSLYLSGCIHIGILLTKHVECSFLYSCIHLHNSFEIDLMEWRFVIRVKSRRLQEE